MVCENKKVACGECILKIIAFLTSGAALAAALYTLIILPGPADISLGDVLSVIQNSDAIDSRVRMLVLNIVIVVIGSIMWIVIVLSLILKWKHNKVLESIIIVLITVASLGFGATGISSSLSAEDLFNIVDSLSQLDQFFTNRTYLTTTGGAAAAQAGISLLASVTSGILALTELALLVKKKRN